MSRSSGRSRQPITAFISYRRLPSTALAHLIANELRHYGIETFVDTRRQDGGGPFPEQLLSAIKAHEFFICLLGKETLESEWVQREIAHAYQTGKVMIPVFQESFERVDPPPSPAVAALLQNQGIHILDQRGIMVEDSIENLAQLMLQTPRRTGSMADPPAGSSRLPVRLTLLALIAAGLVLAAVVLNERNLLPAIFAPPAVPTPGAGAALTLSNGLRMVYVPAGCFLMGTTDTEQDRKDDELPQHEVCLTKPYWIGQYEVTNAEYQQFIASGGYDNREYWSAEGWEWKGDRTAPTVEEGFDAPDQPVVNLSWYEAEAFANWAGGRLPTEAEWEFAARGPQSPVYPWGDTYSADNVNTDNVVGATTAVGSYPAGASWVNAYDMAGNAVEWTADWYSDSYYTQEIRDNPAGPAGGEARARRGGCWCDSPVDVRAAARRDDQPDSWNSGSGMRIVVAVAADGAAAAGLPTSATIMPMAVPTEAVTEAVTEAPAETPTPEAGEVRLLGNGIPMVYVPAGCFMMGTAEEDSAPGDEFPAHEVCLTSPYWIGQYEVTNAEYAQFVESGGYENSDNWSAEGWEWKGDRTAPTLEEGFDAPDQPAVNLTWYEAAAFAAWAGGRLPTEAEWEFAARGAAALRYPWGDAATSGMANVDEGDDSEDPEFTKAVGSYPGSGSWVNAYDLIGNAWEWCADWYDSDYYKLDIRDDPTGADSGTDRVARGGSFYDDMTIARAAYRQGYHPDESSGSFGLRLLIEADDFW